MCPRTRFKDFYTDEELKTIREQWLKDKKRIDEVCEGFYPRDLDREYVKYLNNKNLQMLFKFASHLYWGNNVEGEFLVYPEEEILIGQAYKEILKNGYYDKSKKEEKRVRRCLGIAVKRQTYRRYFTKGR